MVEKCVAPSELHLKKELIALQKARTFRDPETSSSLRSPLRSKACAAYNLGHENEIGGVSIRENISRRLLEMPCKSEKLGKKVYLYNWKNYTSKSSESDLELEEDGIQPSVENCVGNNVRNSHKEEVLGGSFVIPSANICNVRDEDLGDTTPRRSGIRLKKTTISNKRIRKHAANLKQLELRSSPIRALSSVELSDDTGNCNSEDAEYPGIDLLCKAPHSPCASSLFSGSGCANWPRPSKIFRNTRRVDSPHSCTPASTSSYYRRASRKPSTAGSWCATTASFDGDETEQLDLPARQRCGLPCSWSKRSKDIICRGCYSPSLCDTIEKVGDGIFCGSQKIYSAKRSIGLSKTKLSSKSSPNEPLTNLGELDLEALSRLDGRRWSSSKNQAAFEMVGSAAVIVDFADDKSFCLKYKPRIFDEIIGQNIVVQSLVNAVLRSKIAPAYLFHGPRGTGKTSAARIFSAALNCLATEGNKPCCLCKACTASYGENGSFVTEVSATNKDIKIVRYLLKKMALVSRLLQYRILIIDECHLLTSKIWSTILRFLEEPVSYTVLIFITIDPENLPRAILSRCQKYQFSKIKDSDIVYRLKKISIAENLEVETDALNLIAANSDGSLRDAETMLYQLGLLGKRITISLVNDIVGVVSDEKLLDLLELAMSSKAKETVKMSRELVDSGVDPMVLVSQLAGIMMDIIAGTYQLAHSQYDNVIPRGQSLTKDELKRLQQALRILSDAEKQLKQSTEHSSLLTTALLQLASSQSLDFTQPNTVGEYADQIMDMKEKSSLGCNRAQNLLTSQESSSMVNPRRSKKSASSACETTIRVLKSHDSASNVPGYIQSRKRSSSQNLNLNYDRMGKSWDLFEIWKSCIERCYSKTLRQFLSSHGKLISLTDDEGILIAFIAFADISLKLRAERYVSSITNALEMVLQQNVEVRMGLVPYNWRDAEQPFDSCTIQHIENSDLLDNQNKIVPDDIKDLPDNYGGSLNIPRKSRDASAGAGQYKLEKCSISEPLNGGFQLGSCPVSLTGYTGSSSTIDKGGEISFRKPHLVSPNEQKLENAWRQDAEKGTPGFPNLSRTDTNLAIHQSCGSSILETNYRPLRHWDGEPHHAIKALEANDISGQCNVQIDKDKNHYTISPSKLHGNSLGTNFDQQNLEYESGPGCNGLFCWKTNRPKRSQVMQKPPHRPQKTGRLLFRKQLKSKIGGRRSRR